MTLQTNEKRLLDNLHILRTFTDTPQDGVTRFSYGTQDARAREYIIKRAENCGCSVSIDALQNIRIGLPTNKPGRKTVLSGSHIDTVRNGGWLDGIYGVCGALEVLETLAENPDSLKPPEHVNADDLYDSHRFLYVPEQNTMLPKYPLLRQMFFQIHS